MKIFLISYENYSANGRLREFVKCVSKIGEVKGICLKYKEDSTVLGNKIKTVDVNLGYHLKSPTIFFKFLSQSIIACLLNANAETLVICNTPACVPGYFLSLMWKKKKIIYDAYELKLPESRTTKAEKFFSWFEFRIVRAANIVVCANEERAEIMKTFYKLKQKPLVFENIRKIEDNGKVRESIQRIIDGVAQSNINLINTGGYDTGRGADKLVVSMKVFQEDHVLYIVGGGSTEDRNRVLELIEEHDLKNIILLEMLNLTELKCLMKKCDIGIVQYHQKDLNNKYCASGKIYEYMEQGLAIVSTPNPPLLEFCNKYKVGVASEDYIESIQLVTEKIDMYKENATYYAEIFNQDANNQKFQTALEKRITEEA